MSMKKIAFTILVLGLLACAKPIPGPDKQGGAGIEGAATGAVAGAVTGFQVGAGAGPGAAVGAGLGFVAGGIQGMVKDATEEQLMQLADQADQERRIAAAHETLAEHFKRRMALYPTRDIFPADLFFDGDKSKLKPEGIDLVEEISRLNQRRLPWSRLLVVTYVKSADKSSEYAQHLAQHRAREIGDYFVRAGLEPRRINTRAVIIDQPLVLDPNDDPLRYNQAVELVPLDR